MLERSDAVADEHVNVPAVVVVAAAVAPELHEEAGTKVEGSDADVRCQMLLVSFRTKCAILINECNLCSITRDYSFRPLRGLIQDMAQLDVLMHSTTVSFLLLFGFGTNFG